LSDHEHESEPEQPGGEPAAEGPDQPAEQEAALPPKRFRAATDAELDPQSFMVSDDRTAARAILRGEGIGTKSGDAHFIGDAIRRLAGALQQAANRYREEGTALLPNPLLRRLEFGASVTLEFEITEAEDLQVGIDSLPHSPTLDAARDLHALLSAEPPVLVERAAPLGPNAVGAYKGFLNVLAKEDVSLEWEVPLEPQAVVITSNQARRDAAILAREGERVSERLVLPGTLTMADSELRQFKLTLPPGVERPPRLKGKHRVSGTYPEELGQKLKDQSLWDSEVTATIEATFDLPGTTATPRPTTYRLVDAEPLVPPQRLFE
jgi:hypothetical protein